MIGKRYNLKEVAEALRITERGARFKIKKGTLEAHKSGRQYLVTEKELRKQVGSSL